MKRRLFLKSAAAGSVLPLSLNGMSLRSLGGPLGAALSKRGTDKVLVIIQLSGGNDGLNMIIPIDQYSNLSKARSNVIIDQSKVLTVSTTNKTGLHPKMTGLQSMFNNGLVNVVQGIGYPDPNFSHFRATDIWMSGSDSDKVVTTGWMGRYLDKRYTGFPNGYPSTAMPDPLAIQIGPMVSLNFMGPTVSMGMAITDPSSFYSLVDGTTGSGGSKPSDWELEYIRLLTQQTNQYATVVKAAANAGKNLSSKYGTGNPLADQLKIVAKLIHGGLKTPVYMVNLGGFDTHSNQVDSSDSTAGSHADLMKKLSDAIAAFQDDIQLLGLKDRVVGMTFSEFGRRIQSNASGGTDHGAAAPLIVFGEAVQPGFIGNNPVIPSSTTVNDNVPMQFDFRQVYASVLQDWFELTPSEVKTIMNGVDYNTLPIFKSNGAGIEEFAQFVSHLSIENIYPNPSNGQFKVSFQTEFGGDLSIGIFDPLGRRIEYREMKNVSPGIQEQMFDLSGSRNGNYIVQLTSGTRNVTKILLKTS